MTENRKVRDYPFSDPVQVAIDDRFAELRSNEPVSRIRLPYGGEAWLLTRYSDNRALLSDSRFSRAATAGQDLPRLTVEAPSGVSMAIMDPPDHTRLRRLVAPAFAVRQVEQLREGVEAVAAELITAMVAAGPPVDLIEAFALPLPIMVISQVFGVPDYSRHRFATLARIPLSTGAYTSAEIDEAIDELSDYLCQLIDRERSAPSNSLLGELVRARDDDDRLSEVELVTLCGTLLSAGFENITNSLANFVLTLTQNPDLLGQLRAHPELLPGAVEELLRYVMSGLGVSLARIATEDVTIGGVRIRSGEAVFASLPAANHDPEVFTHPETIDFTRQKNAHLAFGHGIHYCLGAQLARMELRTALGALVHRLPGLRLAIPVEEVSWKLGLTVRGPAALPVTW